MHGAVPPGPPPRLCHDRQPGVRPAVKNVELKVEGNILTIRVDLSKEFGPSASGKTTIVASTEGNVAIPGHEAKVGLNVYRPRARGGE